MWSPSLRRRELARISYKVATNEGPGFVPTSTRMMLSGVGSAGILPAIVCPIVSPARPFDFAQGKRRRYLNLAINAPLCDRFALLVRNAD
jgi:hypothetical protein